MQNPVLRQIVDHCADGGSGRRKQDLLTANEEVRLRRRNAGDDGPLRTVGDRSEEVARGGSHGATGRHALVIVGQVLGRAGGRMRRQHVLPIGAPCNLVSGFLGKRNHRLGVRIVRAIDAFEPIERNDVANLVDGGKQSHGVGPPTTTWALPQRERSSPILRPERACIFSSKAAPTLPASRSQIAISSTRAKRYASGAFSSSQFAGFAGVSGGILP